MGSLRGAVASVLNWDIGISEFELQLRYYVHFRNITHGKWMKTPYCPPTSAMAK